MRRTPRGASFDSVSTGHPLARSRREGWRSAPRHQAHWVAADGAAAVALLIALTGHAAGQPPQFGLPGWLMVTASAAEALPIAVRRVWPDAVFVIVLAASTLATIGGVSSTPAVPVANALYTVAASGPPRRSAIALAAALIMTLTAQAGWGRYGQPALSWQVLEYLMTATATLLGAAWAVGTMQRRYAARASAELARRAVMDERLRLARELHDVVSHGITLITAKAAVTNYLPDSGPDQARAALDMIEETGRATLAELRRMLSVLRYGEGRAGTRAGLADDEAGSARAPAPGLAGLAELTAQATAAGVRTSLDIRGGGELPEATALSVYRIVQESLTNVIKHAGPARCAVRVDVTDDGVAVEITDDGYPPLAGAGRADGHGLVGMRERAGLYGGDFSAGPRPEGGFRVAAWLPAGPSAHGVHVRGYPRDE
jgi:signal transduction histidine kinase